jgi:hypothetical protein
MYRVIHKNFAHHHPATPIKMAGPRWKVYNPEDVAPDWPGNGASLTLELDEEQISWLEENDDDEPDAMWDIPVATSPADLDSMS